MELGTAPRKGSMVLERGVVMGPLPLHIVPRTLMSRGHSFRPHSPLHPNHAWHRNFILVSIEFVLGIVPSCRGLKLALQMQLPNEKAR